MASTCNEFTKYLGEIAATVIKIPRRSIGPQRPEIEFPEEMRSRVDELLRSIPELSDLEEKTLRRITGGGSLSFFRVAISTLERLSLGDQPEQIHDDLIDFVSQKKVANFYLAGIGGILLPEKIQLTDQAWIISADDIPPSMAREFVFRIDRLGKVVGHSHEPLRPQAALMVSNDQQVLIPKKSRTPATNALSMDDVRNLEQITLFCLTLASEHAAPVLMARTSWIAHPAQSYHGLNGGSGGTSPGEMHPNRYDKFDIGLVGKFFKDVSRLKEEDRKSLFLAVERLRSSRLQGDPVNRAIDLGIALEIIFLHKTQSNQELTYRVGMRAAFFLGTNKMDRGLIRDLVHTAYAARSSAVHTGQLNKKKLIAALPQADQLCCIAAAKIIEIGAFPKDWESLIFAD